MVELCMFLAAVSIASERVVEIIKNIMNLSERIKNEKTRVAVIHLLAILIGTGFSYLMVKDANLPQYFKVDYGFVILGIMSGAGSSVWNSALVAVTDLRTKVPVSTVK